MISHCIDVLLLSLYTAQVPEGQPLTCYERVEARCKDFAGDEALRCRIQGEAECDVADAERFIAAKDVDNALDRIDDAREKYERLIDITDRRQHDDLVKLMVRYSVVTQSVFPLLSLDRSIDELGPLVERLRSGRQLLGKLFERVEGLGEHPTLSGVHADLSANLVAALDRLGELEIKQAELMKARDQVQARDDAFGTAKDLYDQAMQHFVEARELSPVTHAYFGREIDARLAKSDLYASNARRGPEDIRRACAGYQTIVARLDDFRRRQPDAWKALPMLTRSQDRARAGVAICRSRAGMTVAGAVLTGVGAVTLITAFTLYAQYDRACDYDPRAGYCDGIPASSPDAARYTRQVQVSIGLGVVGGVLAASGAALLIRGAVLRKWLGKPRPVALAPTIGPSIQGLSLRVGF
jgi:hypothetical protein